jgi:hypothetical protein
VKRAEPAEMADCPDAGVVKVPRQEVSVPPAIIVKAVPLARPQKVEVVPDEVWIAIPAGPPGIR